MNKKDPTINQLVKWLLSNFGSDHIDLVDYWEGDLCAIGIRQKGLDSRLIYISTFGCDDLFYNFECEERCGNNDIDFNVTDKGECVTRDILRGKIEEFLFLKAD